MRSPEETESFGRLIADYLFPTAVVLLEGELGSGKTTITRGIAKGLGVNSYVNSPSFLIVKEYQGAKMDLYHMDTYRIESVEELLDIGIEEYFDNKGVVVIEWPEILEGIIPDEYIKITITRDYENAMDTGRLLRMEARGDKYLEIVEELKR